MFIFKLLKQTFAEFSKDNCTRMAAALSYYTAFAIAPLLVIIIAICGVIWDADQIQGTVQEQIASVVGQDGANQIKTMLAKADKPKEASFASIISGILLLVGATGLVGQLQQALNDAWEVKPDPDQGGIWNFVTKRLLSFGMIVTIAFMLMVSLIMSSALSMAGGWIAGYLPSGMSEGGLQIINVLLSLVVITALFALMFKVLPDADVAWSDVAVGAFITALLFVIGKFAMGAYLGSKNMESAYGSAGSLALLLVWIYYSSIILLFGAEFTQVWAKERGGGIKPSKGAVRVVSKTFQPGEKQSSSEKVNEPKENSDREPLSHPSGTG